MIANRLNDSEYSFVVCDLCGSNNYKLYGLAEKLTRPVHPQVVRCNNCGLIYANPQMTATSLTRYYCNEYAEESQHIVSFLDAGFEKTRAEVLSIGIGPGRMLDVGMGWGHYLKAAELSGWEVYGTEISTPFAQYAKEHFGLHNIHQGDLLSSDYGEDVFDLVRMWHVLEHVNSPRAYLTEIFRILKPGGVLIIGVPNSDSLMTMISRTIKITRRLRLADFSAHTYHFTCRTLTSFLKDTGFKISECTVYFSSRARKNMEEESDALKRIYHGAMRLFPNSGTFLKVRAQK